jgi:hypothetical protein
MRARTKTDARGQEDCQKPRANSLPRKITGKRPMISRKNMIIMLKMIKMVLNFKPDFSYTVSKP